MADIIKRYGKYQARVDYYDDDGKRHFKSKSGFKTKKEAQLFVSQMVVDKMSKKFVPNTPPLFYKYFWSWFETYKEKTITNSTIRQYVHTYNILKKYLPTITVDKINRNIYQKFIDDYGQNHAKETVIKINALVHSAVKDAVYDGIMEKDFIPRTSLVYDPNKTWKIDYLNVSEMKQLVEYLKNTRTKNYTSKYMILLAIYTGMRLGEVQGLKWSDINFNFKTITISRSWNAIEHKYQEPKTESSKR
ncbi:tyrosine-type recombinase/integrase, partial [Fructilactobacillus florum]|uniref:tyrosine-type recombinase/integrase n=1 Tax=Fructilactobacillus florum TaxID=640331 RepID=UPI000AEFB1E0